MHCDCYNKLIDLSFYLNSTTDCNVSEQNPGIYIHKRMHNIKMVWLLKFYWSCAVGIATGYVLDDRGVSIRVPIGARILSSPCLPDRFWDPPSLLSNSTGSYFPGA
jgi:hypothetical protein